MPTPDLVIHALAQLPDDVTAEVGGSADEIRLARLVAEAYGVGGRVTLVARTSGARQGETGGFDVDGVARAPTSRRFATLLHEIGGLAGTPVQRGDDTVLADARVAIVTNQPAHYRVPLFNGLAGRLEAAGARLRIFFVQATHGARPWLEGSVPLAAEHESLRSVVLPLRRHRPPSVPRGLAAELERFRPTVVLTAGLSPLVSGQALRAARRLGAGIGVWSGDVSFTSSARSAGRRRLRRRLLEKVDFGIAYGWMSREYLFQLAPTLPVVIGRNAAPLPTRGERSTRAAPVVVAVADLSLPGKGIDVAVDAFSLIPDAECTFEIIGGGHALEAIRERARHDPRIALLGPLPPADTRARLAEADIYIFPSRVDIFGLSLLEAMGAGLACVVAPDPGAVEDLCVPDVNCLRMDGYEPPNWANAIRRLITDPELRATLGSAAADTVAARWTMEHAVDAMVAGLRLGVMTTR